jgi:hypothetical protein
MITNKMFFHYYALIWNFHIVKVGFKYIFQNVRNFESLFFVL